MEYRDNVFIQFVNVCRLLMVRVKNYSVRKCLPLTNMRVISGWVVNCPLTLLGEGLFMQRKGFIMNITVGKSYHISDAFFTLVNEPMLMANKEGSNLDHIFSFLRIHRLPAYTGRCLKVRELKNIVL